MDLLRIVVVLVAVGLSAASAQQTKFQAETVEAPKGVDDKDLYAASVRVFADRNMSIREKDVDAGTVSTEWFLVDSILSSRKFHSWRVMVAEGEVRLMIDCEVRDSDLNSVNACGDDSRVETWVQQVPQLRKAIFAEAQRRARKRARAASAPADAEGAADPVTAPICDPKDPLCGT